MNYRVISPNYRSEQHPGDGIRYFRANITCVNVAARSGTGADRWPGGAMQASLEGIDFHIFGESDGMDDRIGDGLVLMKREGPVAWLTLNRPERLNAFNSALHRDLAAALMLIEQEPPTVLVITGAGRGFCSGQDLTERMPQILAGEAVDIAAAMDQTYNPLIRRLAALPCPVIAAVNGVAAGAGLGLALAADIVVAARSARFILAFGKIGLGPDAGVSWFLPQRIGRSRALALILTGEAMNVEQASEWGIVWKIFDDDLLLAEARALAVSLSAGSPAAQRAAKSLVMDPSGSLDQQLDRERDEQDVLGRTPFYREAVLGFSARS